MIEGMDHGPTILQFCSKLKQNSWRETKYFSIAFLFILAKVAANCQLPTANPFISPVKACRKSATPYIF